MGRSMDLLCICDFLNETHIFLYVRYAKVCFCTNSVYEVVVVYYVGL